MQLENPVRRLFVGGPWHGEVVWVARDLDRVDVAIPVRPEEVFLTRSSFPVSPLPLSVTYNLRRLDEFQAIEKRVLRVEVMLCSTEEGRPRDSVAGLVADALREVGPLKTLFLTYEYV